MNVQDVQSDAISKVWSSFNGGLLDAYFWSLPAALLVLVNTSPAAVLPEEADEHSLDPRNALTVRLLLGGEVVQTDLNVVPTLLGQTMVGCEICNAIIRGLCKCLKGLIRALRAL